MVLRSGDGEAASKEEAAREAKLFARLQALCQLEAMLAACLAAAGPAITLPSLADPLLQLDNPLLPQVLLVLRALRLNINSLGFPGSRP